MKQFAYLERITIDKTSNGQGDFSREMGETSNDENQVNNIRKEKDE